MNRVNAPDGTPLVYDAYEPAHPSVAVLFLHDWHPEPAGLGEGFTETGAQLRDAGFAAYFLDQRGHGRSGGRRVCKTTSRRYVRPITTTMARRCGAIAA